MAVQVVGQIPNGVQDPAESDESIRAKAAVGAVRYYRREDNLPYSKSATTQVGRTRATDHDCHEVPAIWFLDQRSACNEKNHEQDGKDAVRCMKTREGICFHSRHLGNSRHNSEF